MFDVTEASTIPLDYEAVPPDQVVAGTPRTGTAELHDLDGRSVGVWELSVGAMSAVEVDELFVRPNDVVTVEFVDEGRTVRCRANSVGQHTRGQRMVRSGTATVRTV